MRGSELQGESTMQIPYYHYPLPAFSEHLFVPVSRPQPFVFVCSSISQPPFGKPAAHSRGHQACVVGTRPPKKAGQTSFYPAEPSRARKNKWMTGPSCCCFAHIAGGWVYHVLCLHTTSILTVSLSGHARRISTVPYVACAVENHQPYGVVPTYYSTIKRHRPPPL